MCHKTVDPVVTIELLSLFDLCVDVCVAASMTPRSKPHYNTETKDLDLIETENDHDVTSLDDVFELYYSIQKERLNHLLEAASAGGTIRRHDEGHSSLGSILEKGDFSHSHPRLLPMVEWTEECCCSCKHHPTAAGSRFMILSSMKDLRKDSLPSHDDAVGMIMTSTKRFPSLATNNVEMRDQK